MRCAAPPLIGASRCLLLLLSVRRAHRNLAGSSTLVAFHRGHGHDDYPYIEPGITVVEYDPAWSEHFEMLRNEYAAAMAGAGVTVVAIEYVGSASVHDLAAMPRVAGREPGEEPRADLTAYSFLATSGPVMRRSSGMVEAMMPRLAAMPAPVMT